jgi:S-adenosylmethionine:tRNA ribosyltransferase-isomerase
MDEFDYDLPTERVAQVPAEPRDSARLLVDRGPERPVEHRRVRDLPAELAAGDVVVLNDTRVLPARLRLRKHSGGAAEVLLLRPAASAGTWTALVRPARRLRPGTILRSELPGADVEVVVGAALDEGTRLVEVAAGGCPVDGVSAERLLSGVGEVPLPPYVHTSLADPERYQTVYARRAASVAAPTAGLHLTRRLIERIERRHATVATVDLVVGLDTFRPVTVDDPADHVMHSEWYRVPETTWAVCQGAERVVAVGTTTARALEAAARSDRLEGSTDLFIRRPFPFKVVDALLTNFHLPRSTLLLLVDAFVGPRWRDLYDEALADGYRFLSFGDAMFLRRVAPALPDPTGTAG